MPAKRNTNKLSQLYKTIDQKGLSQDAKETLKKLRLATANFNKKEGKEADAFNLFYNRLLAKKPTAIKTTKEYKEMVLEKKREVARKMMEAKKAKQESRQGQGSERDASRPAKPFGWRLKGKHNYRKPTRADISSGKAYYEARINRADSKRTKFPMLERGGYMANGGLIAYADGDYDNRVGVFTSMLDAKKFAKANKWRYETITFEDERGDNIIVSKDDTFKDVDFLFSNDFAKGGYMDKGGEIKNQYEHRTPENVWNNLSIDQRQHFIYDHADEIEGLKEREIKSAEIRTFYKSNWSDLDEDVKNRFANHVREGQYADGGEVDKGGMIYALREFVSSGEIANKTDVLNYDDIAKIRRIAIQYYMDNGDVPYSYGELAKVLSYANDKFKSGYMAKGGNVYSSDDAYEVIILKDGVEVDRVVVRGRNKGEAREMYEDTYESKMMRKHGEDIAYEIIIAPSKMAHGGEMENRRTLKFSDAVLYKGNMYTFVKRDGDVGFVSNSQGAWGMSGSFLPLRNLLRSDLEENLTDMYGNKFYIPPYDELIKMPYGFAKGGSMDDGGNVSTKYAIVDEDTDRIYFRSIDKKLVELKFKEFQEIYPNANLSIIEFANSYAKGGSMDNGGVFYTESHKLGHE